MVGSPQKASPLPCHLNLCHCTVGPCPRMNELPVVTHHLRKLPLVQQPHLLLPLSARIPRAQCVHRLRPLACQVLASDSSLMNVVIRRFCQPLASVLKKCRCPLVILRGRVCPKIWAEWILYLRRLTCPGNHHRLFYLPLIPAIPASLRPRARHRNSHGRSLT
jgi:hypothetical protein